MPTCCYSDDSSASTGPFWRHGDMGNVGVLAGDSSSQEPAAWVGYAPAHHYNKTPRLSDCSEDEHDDACSSATLQCEFRQVMPPTPCGNRTWQHRLGRSLPSTDNGETQLKPSLPALVSRRPPPIIVPRNEMWSMPGAAAGKRQEISAMTGQKRKFDGCNAASRMYLQDVAAALANPPLAHAGYKIPAHLPNDKFLAPVLPTNDDMVSGARQRYQLYTPCGSVATPNSRTSTRRCLTTDPTFLYAIGGTPLTPHNPPVFVPSAGSQARMQQNASGDEDRICLDRWISSMEQQLSKKGSGSHGAFVQEGDLPAPAFVQMGLLTPTMPRADCNKTHNAADVRYREPFDTEAMAVVMELLTNKALAGA
eukprot:jgi/Chrzof1/978/Cz01g35160.t1